MPPTQRRPSDDDLLDAMRDVFAAQGYRAASMADLAAAANSTKPTLYAHFGSKESMYRRVLERERERLLSGLLPVYQTTSEGFLDRIAPIIRTGMTYVAEHPAGYRLLATAAEPGNPMSDVMQDIADVFIDRVDQMIAEHSLKSSRAKDISTRTIAAMVVSSGTAAARQAILVENLDPEIATVLATTYITGALEALERTVL